MSSILRQKLAAQPAVADDTKGLMPLWDGLGRLVSRRLDAEEIGAAMVTGVSAIRTTFEEYRGANDGAQAVFVMGGDDTPIACLGHFDRRLAGLICGHKLGDPAMGRDDAYEPGMLDIMLLQPVIAELFDGFAAACAGLDKASPFADASYREGTTRLAGAGIEDERLSMLALTFNVTVGEGDGALTFLLPYQPVERLATMLASTPSRSVDDPEDPWPPHMLASALTARVTLMAVLDHNPMSVAECARLEVGQVLPLPGVSLNELTVAARTDHGTIPVATGALGVMKQFKAVKLMSDPPEEFIAGLAAG